MPQKEQSFIKKVNVMLKALSVGEFGVAAEFTPAEQTEYAETIALLNEMTTTLQDVGTQADRIASGDYTADIAPRSAADRLGLALQGMTATLRTVSEVADGVAVGDYSRKLEVKGRDDRLAQSLNTMLDRLNDVADKAELISQGDYSVFVEPLSAQDRMGENLRRTIQSLQDASDIAEAVALGDYSRNVAVKGENDLLAKALNTMLGRLNEVVDKAALIAGGDFSVTVEPLSAEDKMGENLRVMLNSLRQYAAENQQQNWFKTGQNDLSETMRGDRPAHILTRQVVTFLAKYVGAQIGAFYLVDDNEPDMLKLSGSYAFHKRKSLNDTFRLGEGLVGQAAFEQEMISITDVPPDYTRINSAIGDAVPRNVVVVPCVFQEQLMGVIELGAFTEFSDTALEFLTLVMENVGVSINSAQSRIRMAALLEASQQQAEELETQQEELRQSNEELTSQTAALQANEDALRRQKEHLQAANIELEGTRSSLERKAAELEVSSKYKSQFLANMSHELRTPLNSLLILSQQFAQNAEGNLTESQIEAAEIVYKSGQDLVMLINEILDLSKIEAGKMELNAKELHLREVVTTLVANFRHMAAEKGVELSGHVAQDLPDSIRSDRQRLNQILKNLLANAIKFTEQGHVTIDIQRPEVGTDLSRSGLQPDKSVAIAVTDTGIGIPHDRFLDIFEAFQQVDGSTSRKYGGTGLGLSISKELATLLGGEIHVSSVDGAGSTFTLYLPEDMPRELAPALHEEGGQKPPNSPPGRGKGWVAEYDVKPALETHPHPSQEGNSGSRSGSVREGSLPQKPPFVRRGPEGELSAESAELQADAVEPPHIPDDRDVLEENDRVLLIVEDDLNFAKTLFSAGHEKGYKCLHGGGGRSGMELAEHYRPDAILLDIGLPEFNGWQVLNALKKNLRTRHIPVHILSVDEVPEALLNKKAIIGYLRKPLTGEQLDAAFTRIETLFAKRVKTLLLVEDNVNLRKSLKKLLEDDTVNVTSAGSGKRALQQLRAKSFDCVVLDLLLPDMPGLELLKTLNDNEEFNIPPVIVYTGKELTRAEEGELRAYTDSIILKDMQSADRLLDEVALFLHSVIDELPAHKQETIVQLHDKGTLLRDKKILVADDDMRNVFAISKVLQDNGMQVYKAANGKDALDILEQTQIDAVLMDIMMPEMDGYETTRAIRSQERFQHLPLIALTAKAMKGDRQKCIEAGANDYLAKPVDIDQLLTLLRVWLSA